MALAWKPINIDNGASTKRADDPTRLDIVSDSRSRAFVSLRDGDEQSRADAAMDHESLRTAATYLNNLLLSRGLLRNGDPIDFVKPSKESRAQIINLVHDLILREDRAKDQREQVAITIRALKTEDTRKTHDIERLTVKNDESARAAAQAQAAERTAVAELKKVERAMKALQDQTAKLKITLAQVKTQCTNDVRKRDLELTRLKTHLQGQQRGNRVGMTAPSMSVRKASAESAAHGLHDPEYSLKQETTEFLTQLGQSLSDENDGLISLLRESLGTMKTVLGLPANVKRHPDSAVGSMGSDVENNGKHRTGSSLLHALPTSYEALASEMESVLSHMKTILTNPNFVSIEEVEMREDEIARLRGGWEHMEKRWCDVLAMMEGWLRRMDTGDTINIDDLRRGMGLVSPNAARRRQAAKQGEPDVSMIGSDTSSIALPDVNEASLLADSPEQAPSQSTSSPKRKRDVLEPPEFFDLRPRSSKSAPRSPPKQVTEPEPALPDLEDDSEELEVPQMTIAEKLSAAQEEAERAAKERARTKRAPPVASLGLDGAMDDERDDDTLGKMPGDVTLGKMVSTSPMAKKTRIRGRPRKRKSTLSPDELEAIMAANAEADEEGF